MPVDLILLLLSAAVVLALAFLVWRYWQDNVRRSPEDEAYEARIAELNQNQANQLSDDQIRAMLDADEAWKTMVRRGRGPRRR